MKKIMIYLFLTCKIFALDIGGIVKTASSSDVSSVLNGVLNGNSSSAFKFLESGLYSIGGESLQSLLSITSNVMPTGFTDMCYQYSPTPISSFKFDLNICSIFNNISTNPCSLAPDLSALGYKKINTDPSSKYVTNLKSYCDNIFGNNTMEKKPLSEIVQNTTSFSNGVVMLPKTTEEKSVNDKKVSEILKDLSSGKDKRAKSITSAVNGQNFEKAEFYRKAVEKTIATGNENVNISELEETAPNVKYSTLEEYNTETKNYSSQLAIALTEIDFRPKLESVEAEMNKVENDTTDRQEALKQKQAIAAQFLKEYQEVLDKNKPFLMAVWDDLREKKYKISNPTKDYINSLPVENKAENVYKIEMKQKEDAMFYASIEDDFRIRIYNAKKMLEGLIIVTAKFDEAAAIERINALLAM